MIFLFFFFFCFLSHPLFPNSTFPLFFLCYTLIIHNVMAAAQFSSATCFLLLLFVEVVGYLKKKRKQQHRITPVLFSSFGNGGCVASMRRLPPLLRTPRPLCRTHPSSSTSHAVSFVSHGPCSTLSFHVAPIASSAATARQAPDPCFFPDDDNNSSSHFTSFELENELQWAQEDLRELQATREAVATVAPAPAGRPTLPHLEHPTASQSLSARLSFERRSSGSTEEKERTKPRPVHAESAVAAQPALPDETIVERQRLALPPLLRGRRWCGEEHARRGESTSGYIDAGRAALSHVRQLWADALLSQQEPHEGGATRLFTAELAAFLREAHVEALLLLLELAMSPTSLVPVDSSDAEACGSPLQDTLLVSLLLQLMCARHVELEGRSMALLSRLLLSCAACFTGASQPDTAVWEPFLFLCYATRRRLRRKHNRDCLEALLWGLYPPPSHRDDGVSRQKRGDAVSLSCSPNGTKKALVRPQLWGYATEMERAARLPAAQEVRRATLHHLLFRCLETETVVKAGVQAAAHADLLLSWSLLLARDEMAPCVRDAVVHRLCKRVSSPPPRVPSAAELNSAAAATVFPASVWQWKRLALKRAAMAPSSGEDHGRHGKALLPGAAVYATVEREARQTGGWSVPAMDRHLLSVLPSTSGPHRSAVVALTSSVGTTHYTRAAQSPAGRAAERELRLEKATTATLRAYVRLRWGPLDSDEVFDCTRTAANGKVKGCVMSPENLKTAVRFCEAEVVELVHTALELPKYAWSLSEAVAVRLLRCLHCRDAYFTAAAAAAAARSTSLREGHSQPTSLTQRQLLAAFRRLTRHSRVDVLTHELLLQGEGSGVAAAATTEQRETHSMLAAANEDPFSLAAFTAAAIPILVSRLYNADEAAQLVDLWLHERRVAALPLSLNALSRLQLWVEALPPSLRSAKLSGLIEQLALVETNRDPLLFGAKRGEDEVASTEVVWAAVRAAAAPVTVARKMHDSTPALSEADVQGTPLLLPAEQPCFFPQSDSLTPQVRVTLQRLQWTALLNESARREWLWSTPYNVSASVTLRCDEPVWPDRCRAVEASENDVTTAAEQLALRELCRRCFPRPVERPAASRNLMHDERKLDAWLTTPVSQGADGPHTGPLEDLNDVCDVTGSTALLWDHAAPSSLKYVRAAHLARFFLQTTDAATEGAAVAASAPLSRVSESAPAGPQEAAREPESGEVLVLQYEEALTLLASHCTHIMTRMKSPPPLTCASGATGRANLRTAAAGFIRCFVAFWHAANGTPFGGARQEPPPNDGVEFTTALCTHYATALALYRAVLLDQQSRLSRCHHQHPHNNKSSEIARAGLPLLPDDLHLGVFQRLTRAHTPLWQRCEDLVVLADDVAVLASAVAAAPLSPFEAPQMGTATSGEPSTFELPLRVYAEVLAAHAAHQRPVPPMLYKRCLEKL